MSTLELKVPPPLVALLVALLMWLVADAMGSVEVPFAYRTSAAVALVLAGLAIRLAAQVTFWRAGTTINPTKPGHTSAVVSSGIYRHTRNPMYLGRAVQLLGWGAFLASPIAVLLVSLYVAYVDRFQVAAEERALRARFGAEYEAYQSKVSRWL